MAAEAVSIMGLPFKRRKSHNKPMSNPSASCGDVPIDCAPAAFFRRRPSFTRSLPGVHAPNRNMIAVVSLDHAIRPSATASLHSRDSFSRQEEILALDDDDEMILPSPSKPTFLSRSIVIKEHPLTLEHAFRVWLSRTDALIKSPEMSSFLSSSCDLALVAGGIAIRTACLPVTAPLQLATTATGVVVGTCSQVLNTTGTILQQVTVGPLPAGQDTSSLPSLQGLLQNILQVIPFTLATAVRIKDGLGSTVMHLVAPAVGHTLSEDEKEVPETICSQYSASSGQNSAEHESFLDRLRLDFQPEAQVSDGGMEKSKVLATDSEVSKYLLHTADLGLFSDEDTPVASVIMYIDLDEKFADTDLTQRALNELLNRGLSLISNVEEARLLRHVSSLPQGCVKWKPESSTERLIRGCRNGDCTDILQTNTLIWSGRMQGRWSRGHDFPFFLARGIVKRNPKQFLELLWDNARTNEYNKHSLGRSDLLVIKDGVLSGPSTGTKVVKSETKVPFTGISVILATLMHARPLSGPEDGFVIVSRSLNSGRAGCHIGSNASVEKSNNEILWGVNILRHVPGNPNMTDLTSISQVATSLVPKFLAHRIGIMGVEDFFTAVRC